MNVCTARVYLESDEVACIETNACGLFALACVELVKRNGRSLPWPAHRNTTHTPCQVQLELGYNWKTVNENGEAKHNTQITH